ncbi:hypothetical protein [Micromonospora sp. RTP1Z1]|uniref:hypothetical protein n=1 Tax=Micromonospora sp. RTP1Z1 TaxID=2994043 RepID=UPI0029C67CE3|nr:hypothetical protein [Micromonospora sp. RTP1Z1]
MPGRQYASTSYESAGRRSGKVHISKIAVELRQAIIALGVGITLHHPDFAAYKRRLIGAGKKRRPEVPSSWPG